MGSFVLPLFCEWGGGGELSELNLSADCQKRLDNKIQYLNIPKRKNDSIGKIGLSKFVKYAKERNINLLTKTEWQQSFFFFYTSLFCNKNIFALSTDDIYKVSDEFGLLFDQTQNLIKKCNYLEIKTSEHLDFKNFYNRYLKNVAQTVNTDKKEILIEVPNPIILELYRRLLRKMKIFQDYSFNKDIVRISVDTFMDLMNIKKDDDSTEFEEELIKILKPYLSENDEKEIKKRQKIKDKLSYVFGNIVYPVGINVISQLITMKIGC